MVNSIFRATVVSINHANIYSCGLSVMRITLLTAVLTICIRVYTHYFFFKVYLLICKEHTFISDLRISKRKNILRNREVTNTQERKRNDKRLKKKSLIGQQHRTI